ncbi:DUF4170 domain-containing protein [Faunimonas sp. B44]|uniref:DUF4170 domain-containing protein n=1 Tax=Faunimonas sp. B44 TaxID=3461493 RepID=UPI0040449CCA
MNKERFWVIGGEFQSLQFDRLVDGTERIMGPFAERGDAEQAWRQVSEQFRHQAAVRFTIAQEPRFA